MGVWPPEFECRGTHMRIAPLSFDHIEDLKSASADGDLSKLWYTWVPTPADMEAEITRRLNERTAGRMQPFTVFDTTGRAVGMTTFMNIDVENKRVEIGSTWYAKSAQRTPLNTECKIALLSHAFEKLDCIAVEFRTHFLNHQSRRAIERLGAKLDGVLRSHMMVSGVLRDTAVYSIIAAEWPTIKTHLTYKLSEMS